MRQTEVSDHKVTVKPDEQVRWLHVSMNDPIFAQCLKTQQLQRCKSMNEECE